MPLSHVWQGNMPAGNHCVWSVRTELLVNTPVHHSLRGELWIALFYVRWKWKRQSVICSRSQNMFGYKWEMSRWLRNTSGNELLHHTATSYSYYVRKIISHKMVATHFFEWELRLYKKQEFDFTCEMSHTHCWRRWATRSWPRLAFLSLFKTFSGAFQHKFGLPLWAKRDRGSSYHSWCFPCKCAKMVWMNSRTPTTIRPI